MKLAKKVLAIVMALGLVACMSAMAFAANAGSYDVSYVKSEDGKTLVVSVYALDYIGLTSGSINVDYSGGLKYDHASMGEAAKAVNETVDNSFVADVNNTGAGKVIYGFYFKEMMWDTETFAAHAEEGERLYVNVACFDIVHFTFKLDGSAYDIKVTVTSKSFDGDNATFYDENTGAAVVAPTEPTPVVPGIPGPEQPADPKPCDPTPCDPTPDYKTPAKPVKTDGGKNTGDDGVIAVVAGVVALAGVAFVVTKKRK